jgi:hypothetical protein
MSSVSVGFICVATILVIFVGVDAYLYQQGHDTFFFEHKTEDEKRIREAKIRLLEKQAGIRADEVAQ